MWTFSPVETPGTFDATVTVDLLTSYEGGRESTSVVLHPVNGEPTVVYPFGQAMGARTGTFVATLSTWGSARALLDILEDLNQEGVWLIRDGVAGLHFLPTRSRHRVLPDELDMHEVTIEWLQLGGVY